MTVRDYDKICQLATLCDHAHYDVHAMASRVVGTDQVLIEEISYHFQAALALLDEIKTRNA